MKHRTILVVLAVAGIPIAQAQPQAIPARPDPKEIPVPPIATSMKKMPGVNELPNRPEMPDVLTMNNGKKVTTPAQWNQRRQEMKQILEYYAVGQAPPAPGNVKGHEVSSEVVMNGKVKYRLVHLTFGPQESLSLDIGVFTPAAAGPVPAVISPSGSPPGATPLPRLAQGPNQGRNEGVLLLVGPGPQPAGAGAGRGPGRGPRTAESVAAASPVLAHGFVFVTFDNNDCAEDTTLRNADGSWAYRTTRFYPAYPKYDWGVLQGWAWGVSRTGKSALVAGAFDARLALVAPVASSGGGTPAYRFSGSQPPRGGKEGLTEMVRKYPNWFSDHLHEFWGQPDKLPFDSHWFMALVAPRPFIAIEGTHDQNVVANGVRQAFLAAQPAYALLSVEDRLGVSWADRPHGMVEGDWDALFAFADKFLMGKPSSADSMSSRQTSKNRSLTFAAPMCFQSRDRQGAILPASARARMFSFGIPGLTPPPTERMRAPPLFFARISPAAFLTISGVPRTPISSGGTLPIRQRRPWVFSRACETSILWLQFRTSNPVSGNSARNGRTLASL